MGRNRETKRGRVSKIVLQVAMSHCLIVSKKKQRDNALPSPCVAVERAVAYSLGYVLWLDVSTTL